MFDLSLVFGFLTRLWCLTGLSPMFDLSLVFGFLTCLGCPTGPKQQRKFKRLMLHRIKWSEGKKHTKDEGEGATVPCGL